MEVFKTFKSTLQEIKQTHDAIPRQFLPIFPHYNCNIPVLYCYE
jgi:hypothetical protein